MARVLVVSFGVVPGPDRHGAQLPHVIKALAGRFGVDVLTLRAGCLPYVERFHKTRMLRVPVPEGPLAGQVEAFRRAVRRQIEGAEYDIVHFRDSWGGLPALERRRELGLKTVFDLGRSALGDFRPVDVKLAADLARDDELCLARADLVIVPTETGKEYLARRGRAEGVVVVPPGVDVDRFDAEPCLSSDPPRVVFVGTLGPGRGVRILLRAFAEVVPLVPARLHLVGPVEKRFAAPLVQAIEQLGLASLVDLLGPVENEDIPRVVSAAAVCVAPAAADISEHPTGSFPTKILEYAACGRPVVAPRCASVLEVLSEREDCLLFEPGKPGDLATRILSVLREPRLGRRLGASARLRVRERFPASATRRRVLEAYATLVSPEQWTPLGEAAQPIPVSAIGATGGGTADEVVSDTNPAAPAELAGPPTSPAIVADPGDPTPATAPTLEHDTDGDGRAPARGAPPAAARTEPWALLTPEGATPTPPSTVPVHAAEQAGEVEARPGVPGAERPVGAGPGGDGTIVDVDLDLVLSEEGFASMGSLLGGPTTDPAAPQPLETRPQPGFATDDEGASMRHD